MIFKDFTEFFKKRLRLKEKEAERVKKLAEEMKNIQVNQVKIEEYNKDDFLNSKEEVCNPEISNIQLNLHK